MYQYSLALYGLGVHIPKYPHLVLTYMGAGLRLAFVAEKPGRKSEFHAGYFVEEGKQSIIGGNTVCKSTIPRGGSGGMLP